MKLPISKRLLACCGFVFPGARVADIGCDHGYLSIHLLTQGLARSVIAADIREQPLLSAVRNAEKYGIRDQIEFYLSDGVQSIPRDFDTMVCAGMGGDTMISILEAAPWLKSSAYRLILQCQSKTHLLRHYLSSNSWRITEEPVLRDGRFLYTVMEVYYEPDCPRLTVGQCYFPPAMLENPSKETVEYYHQTITRLERAALGADNTVTQALAELKALAQDPNLTFLKEDAP